MLAYSPYCHIGIFRYAKFISDDRKSAYLFLPQANLIHNSIQSYQKTAQKNSLPGVLRYKYQFSLFDQRDMPLVFVDTVIDCILRADRPVIGSRRHQRVTECTVPPRLDLM